MNEGALYTYYVHTTYTRACCSYGRRAPSLRDRHVCALRPDLRAPPPPPQAPQQSEHMFAEEAEQGADTSRTHAPAPSPRSRSETVRAFLQRRAERRGHAYTAAQVLWPQEGAYLENPLAGWRVQRDCEPVDERDVDGETPRAEACNNRPPGTTVARGTHVCQSGPACTRARSQSQLGARACFVASHPTPCATPRGPRCTAARTPGAPWS
jgi:hypothetical protein